ncbi:phage major capsid protein [Aliarcobacter cryaerophilus]|uniref:phage major capsid protein n=1 Tax=Aliarcobacter cryaerophilus TaxID=28198 RepID=UPI0021B39224|nr:phage major capsid protein [Aliarcobacter cryaerophilus]MCT7469192.1 phage major capsid protein [Aliarcobacter cryaerophilus]
MNIKSLKAQREELTAKMSELVNNQRSGETMSDTDKATFEDAKNRVKAIDEDITRIEELRSLQTANAISVNTNDDVEEFRSFLKGQEVRSQTVGTNTAGGYTVGASVANRLIEAIRNNNGMIESASTITTAKGDDLNYPTLDDTDAANDAVIKAETDARRSGPDLVFGSIPLKSFTYDSGIIKISNELVQDSAVNIEQVVINALSKRIQRKLQKDFTIGAGTTAPAGLLTSTLLGKKAATANGIVADELLELQFSVESEYAANGKYMMNSKTLLAISKLKDGQGNYLLSNAVDGISKTLFGKQIVINDNMPDIASKSKPVVFGDLSQYLIRNVKGINVFKFNEKYQDTNEIGFKASARFDGVLLQPAAVKHLEMAA